MNEMGQIEDLKLYILKGLDPLIIPSRVRIVVNRIISERIDLFAEAHDNPFEMKIDVLDLLIKMLQEHEEKLEGLIDRLEWLTSWSHDAQFSRQLQGDNLKSWRRLEEKLREHV